jgi:hypothetical protein
MWRGTSRAALIAATAAVASCGSPPADPPGVVIVADPPAICQDDAYRTTIVVDGSRSTARLTHVPVAPPPGEPPLSFTWSFAGASSRIVGGDPNGPRLEIRTAGDRPLHVTLTARTASSGEGSTTLTIPITVAEPGSPCGAR